VNLRARVRAAIPPAAFLRRDRGDALYVTDAPRHGFSGEIPGLRAAISSGLMRLYVTPGLLDAWDFPPDALALSLVRFRSLPPAESALCLFAEGLKCLEDPNPAAIRAYDKRLRQAAAVALRAGGGGGLYACALLGAELARRGAGENAEDAVLGLLPKGHCPFGNPE
jgi:hypothetical protein